MPNIAHPLESKSRQDAAPIPDAAPVITACLLILVPKYEKKAECICSDSALFRFLFMLQALITMTIFALIDASKRFFRI